VKYSIPRVVIAGLKGGSGKTTLSLGLLSLLNKSEKRIVPFKKGPDYIDPGWLSRAAGQSCYNLDSFLFSEKLILDSFLVHASGADGALIEGNRGVFDGMDEKGTFSTARLAISLSAPVIITIDCTKTTTTIAALVKGVLEFDSDLEVGGIVLNQLAGERHESIIRSAIETHTDGKVIGAFRRLRQDLMEERHLGLVPHQESDHERAVLERITDFVRDSVNIDDVVSIMDSAPSITTGSEPAIPWIEGSLEKNIRIGVLKDVAFQFYYPENLDFLEHAGAEIIVINALEDSELPDVDALYIGGGFPETQAEALSKNVALMRSIKASVDYGLPVYAECGGLMFLGEEIEFQGSAFRMCGVLPIKCVMGKKPAAHGYTLIEVVEDNPYFESGTELRGHEFHYSKVVDIKDNTGIKLVFKMGRGEGLKEGYDGIVYRNVLATYTHLHTLGSPEWVRGMVKIARRFRSERRDGE
jgi:cobyrinic acid a,c-diamide synthase